MLRIARLANNSTPATTAVYFVIEDIPVGILSEKALHSFKLESEFTVVNNKVEFKSATTTQERTEIMNQTLSKWRELGIFTCLDGWRNEVRNPF